NVAVRVSHAPPHAASDRQETPAKVATNWAGTAPRATPAAHSVGARGPMVSCDVRHHSPAYPGVPVATGSLSDGTARPDGRPPILYRLPSESPAGIGIGARLSERPPEVLRPPRRNTGAHDRLHAQDGSRGACRYVSVGLLSGALDASIKLD